MLVVVVVVVLEICSSSTDASLSEAMEIDMLQELALEPAEITTLMMPGLPLLMRLTTTALTVTVQLKMRVMRRFWSMTMMLIITTKKMKTRAMLIKVGMWRVVSALRG